MNTKNLFLEPEALQKKINFYQENNKPIHIKFRQGFWKNGFIKDVRADFFMLDEFQEGITPVFFLEIADVTEFTYGDLKK